MTPLMDGPLSLSVAQGLKWEPPSMYFFPGNAYTAWMALHWQASRSWGCGPNATPCTLTFTATRNSPPYTQTWHSIEMKNLDLTNKKSGSRGKNQDHGRIGLTNRNNSPKERTICSFFLPRNVLNCQTSVFFHVFFVCVSVLFSCLFPQTSP